MNFRVSLDEHNGNGDHPKSNSASLFETAGKACEALRGPQGDEQRKCTNDRPR
jgi:hypothetical protein